MTGPDSKATILVADDSERVREVTAAILRGAGFDVTEAATGEEALRLARQRPDLIVLDVHLPDIDGLEVCRRIKASRETASIPVLHLSGTFREPEDRVRGLETGADGYLTKPVGAAELVATVRALLRVRKAEADLGTSEVRRRAAETLLEVGRLLAQSLDPREVGQRVADSVRALLEAQTSILYRLEDASGDLVTVAMSGDMGPALGPNVVLAHGTGVSGLAVRERRPVITANVLTDPRIRHAAEFRKRVEQAPFRAVLAVPLLVQDRVIGALAVGDRPGRVFEDEEVRVVLAFADQAALALQNARVYEEAERRRREAEVLAELARTINASPDLATVLQRVAEGAQELCGSDMARIALRERGAETMAFRYWVGSRYQGYAGLRIEPGKGVGGQVLVTGRPFRTDEWTEDPRFGKEYLEVVRKEGTVAQLAAPIRIGDRIEGLLYVDNRAARPFTDRDESILLRLADHAAIAIRNAWRLEEVWTHQGRLEGLLEVSRQLSRIQPLESLLDTIAETCGTLIGTESVGFRLVDGGELVVTGTWGDAKEAMATPRLKIGESLSGLVAATGEILLVNNLADDPRLVPLHRQADRRLGHRAFLGVPLRAGGRILGVLSIRTKRQSGFSLNDVSIAQAFASQAATALENARLYQEAKRAYEELKRTQDQLLQAQKMEAIGQLAGGVAHDFNNLLTVIKGRSGLLLHRLGPDDPVRRQVALIDQTAERAATLTQQLLAFSRRQMLQPRVLDLGAVAAGMEKMLRRLIGEDVILVMASEPGLGRVKADPGQIEQVILNLAVNARDAMLRGGTLTIETANAELDAAFVRGHPGAASGPHVMLAISDTGVGMDAETRAHLFEPFFTTKEVGKGTGLGLATVYGIVKQSGGYIGVSTGPGRGARFEVYLPRVEGTLASTEGGGHVLGELLRGYETILLTEDQDEVRELARDVLRMSGYTVLEAGHGAAALRISEQHTGPLHLLVTDVVMPQMSGRELAERLVAVRPGLKVLYMSGYAEDAVVRDGVLGPDASFLPKPFTPDGLARRVREVLDGSPEGPG